MQDHVLIIALHGFNQNPEDFYRSIVKLFPKKIDKRSVVLKVIPGQVVLPSGNRAYWYYNPEDPMNMEWSDHRVAVALGLEKSIECVKTNEAELRHFFKGEITLAIGFSQGGMFLDHLIKTDILKPKGSIFLCTKQSPLLLPSLDKVATPSMHFYGENDGVIIPKYSLNLAEQYKTPEIFSHQGKHVIPHNSFTRTSIRKFLEALLAKDV